MTLSAHQLVIGLIVKKYGPNYKEKLDQGMVKFIEDCRAENKRLVEKRPDTSNYQ